MICTKNFNGRGVIRIRRQLSRAGIIALLLGACLVAQPAFAADDAGVEDKGFFSYLPNLPHFSLPKIDVVPFWTSDLKIARKAYNNGNYERALKYFRKASEDGHATADWYLGHMYRLGRGVQHDDGIAYSYYSRAADAYEDDETSTNRQRIAVDCKLRLAQYHQTGIAAAGIAADPQSAARAYLEIASSYGHPAAMYGLGVMTINGDGVPKNPQQGLKWIMSAARKRNAMAQAYLGDAYAKGEIVRQDDVRSLMWYMLAADSATTEEETPIRQRLDAAVQRASSDVQLEADARAKVFADQFPAKGAAQE